MSRESTLPPPPSLPWTVMLKYLKKPGILFWITEIEADSAEEAVAEVLAMQYCLSRDAWEITAKQVPVIEIGTPPKENENGSSVQPHEPQSPRHRAIVRPLASRQQR